MPNEIIVFIRLMRVPGGQGTEAALLKIAITQTKEVLDISDREQT